MKKSQKKSAHAMTTDTETLMAALMIFAVALEDCCKAGLNINEMSANEKRKWVWNGKNLLVAKPFYSGIFQAMSTDHSLKKRFGKEWAYIEQNLNIADVMLRDPRILILFDDDEMETVH